MSLSEAEVWNANAISHECRIAVIFSVSDDRHETEKIFEQIVKISNSRLTFKMVCARVIPEQGGSS